MKEQDYRPCPICKGTHSEGCECCEGKGRFPYPWVMPGDKMVRKRWEDDENEVIYSAFDPMDAYQRYIHVYGTAERSLFSVYRHWQYIHETRSQRAWWSTSEKRVLEESVNIEDAIESYRHIYGTGRSDVAIKVKYSRVSALKKQGIV